MGNQLSIRIKYGDEQAFELLFRQIYTRLCCSVNKYLNDPEETKEVIQEVFTILWESRKKINPDCSLEAYVFKIAKNLSLTRLRRKKIESRYTEILKVVYVECEEGLSVHEKLCAHELENKIGQAVSKLPEGCRKIYEMSRNEGLKYSEIAKALNISVKTVEAQMSKAFRMLRLVLTEYISLITYFIILRIYF